MSQGKIISFSGHARPSSFTQNMAKHRGDVSEGSQDQVEFKRWILGKRVHFYRNGRRKVFGIELDEQEQHQSELLRLTHASLLIHGPVGEKAYIYVDATKGEYVEVWINNKRAEEFVKDGLTSIRTGALSKDFLLDSKPNDVAMGLRKGEEVSDEKLINIYQTQTIYVGGFS